MTVPAKIYSSFAEVARRQGICIAVITETGNTSYQALLAAVDNVAAAMTARGIAARHLIAVNFGRGELYLVALLAASRIGASIVFASFADADRLARSPDFRLADDRVPPIERGTAMVVDASWYNPLPAMAMPPMPTPEGQLHFATSGSTGDRKFVALSESAVLARLPSRRSYIGSGTRLFSALGARTAVTIESRLATLLIGGSIVVLGSNRDIPHFIDLFGINTMMSAPMVLEDLLRLDLPRRVYASLKTMTIGGAAPSGALLEALVERFCPHIIVGYGNTELGSITQYTFAKADYRPGKVGKAVPGIEISIVDDRGQDAPPGTTGRIRIRPSAGLPAFSYADGSSAAESLVDGWFVPGDRGWFDEEGNLTFAGRTDNVINAGGNKFSVELIESEVESRSKGRCIVLRGEKSDHSESVSVVIVDPPDAIPGEAVARFLASRFHRLGITAIYQTSGLAATESIKKDRSAMAERLRASPQDFKRLWPADEATR